MQNLINAFPNKSEAELIQIQKEFYIHLCDSVIENIKCLSISKKEIQKRFTIKNIDLIEQYYDDQKSVIIYAAHQGNWEWLSFIQLYTPYTGTALYKPISNSYFNDLMKTIRGRFGIQCIKSNNGYKAMVKFKQKNILSMTAIIGDQSPSKESAKHWTNFLNQDTAFLIGADRIAKKTNQMVVFPKFSKLQRGYYELELIPIEHDPQAANSYEIIDKYAQLLEEAIKQSPALWLWSHRRWKLSRN